MQRLLSTENSNKLSLLIAGCDNLELYEKGAERAAYEYAGTIISAVLQFLISILLVRMLALPEYGIYNILLSTLTLVLTITFFTIASIPRYLPEFYEKKNYYLIKKITKSSLFIRLVTGLLVVIVFFFFPDSFNSIFKGEIQHVFLKVFSLVIAFALLNEVMIITLNALLEQKTTNAMKVIFNLTFLAFSYFALKNKFGLKGVLYSIFLSGVIVFLIASYKTYSVVFTKPSIGTPEHVFKRVFRYTVFQYFAKLGDIALNLTFSIYLIGFFYGMQITALYSFGAKIPGYILSYAPPIVATSVLFFVGIRRYTETKSKEQLSYFFSLYNRFIAFFIFPMAAGLVLLGLPIINYVFDPKYLGAYKIFILSIIGYSIWSFHSPIAVIYNILERPDIGFYSKIFVIYNLIASVILIPIYGMLGAIIPTVTTMLFTLLSELYLTKKIIDLSYPFKSFFRIALNTAIMSSAIFLLKNFIYNVYSLILVIVVGTLLYFMASFLNKPFEGRDRELFNKMGKLGNFLEIF